MSLMSSPDKDIQITIRNKLYDITRYISEVYRML